MGQINGTYLKGLLWELNKLRYVKHLEQCLAHSKPSINSAYYNLFNWLFLNGFLLGTHYLCNAIHFMEHIGNVYIMEHTGKH